MSQITELQQTNQNAGPVPPPYGDGPRYQMTETGAVIDDMDIPGWKIDTASPAASPDTASQNKAEQPKQKNRTLKQAQQAGAVVGIPKKLALPTLPPYQYAMSTNKNTSCYLQPVLKQIIDNMAFQNGKLYFAGTDATNIDLEPYYDNQTETISMLDIPMLRALYTILADEVGKEAGRKSIEEINAWINDPQYTMHSVRIYLPAFLKAIGRESNCSKNDIDFAIKKITSYSNVMGIETTPRGPGYFPLMIFGGYHPEDNTIQFASPYLNRLVITLFNARIKTEPLGRSKLKRNGKPFMLPTHSYMVKTSIIKERNKRAVEIVCAVVTVIEQAGRGIPHIKGRTLVNRVPDLKNAIETAASCSDQNKILRRAFKKAWELLRTQTDLKDHYKNIQFPTKIPTMTKLDDTIKFPHEGKTKKKDTFT